jgi:hypothetical protein
MDDGTILAKAASARELMKAELLKFQMEFDKRHGK